MPVLVALCSLPLASATAPGAAGPPARVEVAPAVEALVRDEGSARVLVELAPRRAWVAEGRLPGEASVAEQRAGIAAATARAVASLRGSPHAVLRRYETVPYVALEVRREALARLERRPDLVLRVIEDRIARPSLAQSVPLIEGDSAWGAGFDGSGQLVAVLDTGVASSHPFLAGKVVEEACYSSTVRRRSATLCPNGQEEQLGPGSGVNCPLSLFGCDHGTHVAGIVAGDGEPAGKSFSGPAKGASLMAVQVFSRFDRWQDCGFFAPCIGGWSSDVIAGLERVYLVRSEHAVAAANLSLGEGLFSSACDAEPYKPIIDNLRSVGIATVAASGNNGSATSMTSPACISTAVSVGSTTTDAVSSFSNSNSSLSLLAPGDPISSSVPGGGYASYSGTSMATPHVAGAWAVLKQAAPAAGVDHIMDVLAQSGTPIRDARNGVVTPRIRIVGALGRLMPGRPLVAAATPASGTQGESLSVAVSGANFEPGAGVSFGTGIAVEAVTVVSADRLAAELTIDPAAATGLRDVTVTNPSGASGTLPGAFRVLLPPPSLSLVFEGKLRDRVGQGSAAVAPDGLVDGVFRVSVGAGSGSRTVSELELRRADGGGIWDTTPSTYWVAGTAESLDGPLANDGQGAVAFSVAEGGSFYVFAADTSSGLFAGGAVFRLTVRLADGSVATAETTLAAPPPPAPLTLSLAFEGKLRDRVGQGSAAVAPDGMADGVFRVSVGGGPRTVSELELRRMDGSGIWDTTPSTYWVAGAAGSLDGSLFNRSTGAVSFPVGDGESFYVFASDTSSGLFVGEAAFRLTVKLTDGSVATAETTLVAPPPPAPLTLSLAFEGKLRDRVGQGSAAVAPDGLVDGVFRVSAGGGPQTVSELELRRADGGGIWDTTPSTYWVAGAAASLDGSLFNGSTGAVSFPVGEGESFYVFASDTSTGLFVPGAVFRVTVELADGTSATADVVLP